MHRYFYMNKLATVILVVFSLPSFAQKIQGRVYTEKGDLLPYASVILKGTTTGASANNVARYSIAVSAGTYTVVCQHVGYARQEKKVVVGREDVELNFIMPLQKLTLNTVVVKSGAEDPAYAIIRQAIKKRPFYGRQVKGFECDLYTKDIVKLRNLPRRVLGQKVQDEDRKEMGLDSTGRGIIYLSESVARVHAQEPSKFKMEVLSSRVSGSGSFGFTFPTFISLYDNNVSIFSGRLNPRGFISPIADGAIGFYRYKFLGSFFEDGREVNSIRVIPRRQYEPLFSGIINITEGEWRIHSLELTVTRTSQLEILDTLQISQVHVPVGADVWRVKNQVLHFNFKQFGIDAIGNFVNVYSDYRINPAFPRDFFNRVVIHYDTAVNKRPKAYWDTIRPVPLEPEEKKDYQVKDSIYETQRDSSRTRASADSLNRKQGKVKLYNIFWKGLSRTHYNKSGSFSWNIESLVKNLEYNTAEGLVVDLKAGYNRYLKKWKTNFSVEPIFRYGFSNTHFNAWANVLFRTRDWSTDKKLRRQAWAFSGGKRVSQFNSQNPITPFINSINTLFWGDNFMKTYENYFGSIGFSKRYESGLRFGVNALYEDRIPLDNTTLFTFFKKDSVNIKPNYPYEKIPSQFQRHQAFILSVDVSIRPGQRYIEFPRSKVPIGSKYPTISFNYTKGIPTLFGSDVDFDKWRLTVNDDKNFKLAGELKYKLGIGGFLNTRSVFIQDYQHFNGNRSTEASEYVNSFQLAPYYANSTMSGFYSFGHVEHHFNGLFTNKIPLFRRLDWNLVAGSNVFYVNGNNNYMELFAGLENILKVFRVDLVAAYTNGNKGLTGIRIGTGGVVGGRVRSNSRGNSLSISF
jgi:hypothetical protein